MESFSEISRELHHPDEEIRRRAVEKLSGRAGGESLVLLNEALGDESWRVRKSAIEVIVRHPDKESTINTLLNALYDSENVGRRSSAIEALVNFGETAIDAIIDALKTYDPDVRKFLVDILGEIGTEKVLPGLLSAVEDKEENVRLAVIEALGKVGSDKAYQVLLNLVEEGDLSIRFSALHTLSKLGKGIPFELIERLLKEKIFKRAVYEVLGQIPDVRSVEILLDGLEDPSKSARQQAVRSIAKIYNAEGQSGLKMLIEEGLQRKLKEPKLIAEFLEGGHIYTKQAVVQILGLLKTEKVLQFLFPHVIDSSLRDQLIEIFVRFEKQSPEKFYSELKKQNEEVRKLVESSIQEEKSLLKKRALVSWEMSDSEFNYISSLLSREFGFSFDKELKYIVERKVKHRLDVLGLSNFSVYLRILEDGTRGQTELYELGEELATNETYFFREEFQLRAFQEEILPEVIAYRKKRGENKIKIWSAGCSSGEEPFTVAMLLSERKDLEGLGVEIYASDLSQKMVARAIAGIYGPSSFRVMDSYFLDKYFVPVNQRYQLKSFIRNMVKFEQLNLLSFYYPDHLKDIDILFCRNVIIYFTADAKKQVIKKFESIIRPEGFLLLGHSESLINITTAFRLRHLHSDLVYQKPGEEKK